MRKKVRKKDGVRDRRATQQRKLTSKVRSRGNPRDRRKARTAIAKPSER